MLACSFCLAPCDNLSEPIEKDVCESLAQLLPHLDLGTRNAPQVACADCSTKLKSYLEFKSSFMQAQACVQSFRTEQNSGVDLRQVYLQNKGGGCEMSTDGFAVCRFCLKQTTGAYVSLLEDEKELTSVTIMTNKCFPGLELGTIQGCVICFPCHEALEASYNFVTSSDVEVRIKKEEVVEEMEFEKGPEVKTALFILDGFSSGNGCVDLKAVKKEEDSFAANRHGLGRAVEANLGLVEIAIQESATIQKVKTETVQADGSSVNAGMSVTQSGPPYVCEICSYETRIQDDLRYHHRSHKVVPLYKCQICSYETRHKYRYNLHETIHKSPSEVTMYKCESCAFQTRHKRNMKYHILIHKNPSEVQLYKCDTCPYETRHKSNYNQHTLMHKSRSEAQKFNCEHCAYKSNMKKNLKAHMLVHKKRSEVTRFACKHCPFQTTRKHHLKNHELTHKDPLELPSFKCEACTYETKSPKYYKQHMLVHMDISEIDLYACTVCPYKAKTPGNLTQHMRIHKNVSEVTTYKCDVCSFETKYKNNVKQHMRIHKNPSEVPMYICGSCTYETRYKRVMKRHEQRHLTKIQA